MVTGDLKEQISTGASEMKAKKDSNLRRLNNKMLKEVQVVMKKKWRNYELWNYKLSKVFKMTLPGKDDVVGPSQLFEKN